MRFACLFCCTQLSVQSHVASFLSARSLVEGMEPSFCAQLQTAGIHADIIAFLGNDKKRVYSITGEANIIDQRSEIQSHILNHVAVCKDDRGSMRALARGGHRRATPALEQGEGLDTKRLRGAAAHRRARWVLGQVRGVLPLPPLSHGDPHGTACGTAEEGNRQEDLHSASPGPCPQQQGEYKQAMEKRLPLTTNMALFLGADEVPISERPVVDNHLAVYLCKVLWEGGWAVVGNFEHTDGSADEDTRALYAASLQKGLSLDLAIKTNEGKKAALWLWACGDEAAKVKTLANSTLEASGTIPSLADFKEEQRARDRDHGEDRGGDRRGGRGDGRKSRPNDDRHPRSRALARAVRQHGQGSATADNHNTTRTRGNNVLYTKNNNEICRRADGKALHICNFRLSNDNACSQHHWRCEHHW